MFFGILFHEIVFSSILVITMRRLVFCWRYSHSSVLILFITFPSSLAHKRYCKNFHPFRSRYRSTSNFRRCLWRISQYTFVLYLLLGPIMGQSVVFRRRLSYNTKSNRRRMWVNAEIMSIGHWGLCLQSLFYVRRFFIGYALPAVGWFTNTWRNPSVCLSVVIAKLSYTVSNQLEPLKRVVCVNARRLSNAHMVEYCATVVSVKSMYCGLNSLFNDYSTLRWVLVEKFLLAVIIIIFSHQLHIYCDFNLYILALKCL